MPTCARNRLSAEENLTSWERGAARECQLSPQTAVLLFHLLRDVGEFALQLWQQELIPVAINVIIDVVSYQIGVNFHPHVLRDL